MPGQTRTAVIVARDPLWLGNARQTLAKADVDVVATTTLLNETTRTLERLQPDLVVLEFDPLADEVVPQWLSQTARSFPHMKIIVLSDNDDPDCIDTALKAGASGYVLKQRYSEDLAVTVRQAYDRSLFLLGQYSQPAGRSPTPALFDLTRREKEILSLAAEGLSNREIARKLWVTEQTVKFHLSNIYAKLGVTNRTAASRLAQVHGLLAADEPAG
jgi:NarL family two-component system response regulator LiaR